MAQTTGGYIVVTLKAYQEGNQYVSECPELDVASCGDTLDEAFRNVEDALLLYLKTIEKLGERERVFKERGIEVRSGAPPARGEEVQVRARPDEFVSPHAVPLPSTVAGVA